MPTWTLNNATFASLGLSRPVLRFVNQKPDTLSFDHAAAAFDADLLFTHGETVTVKRDGVVWFVGKIRQTPRRGASSAESIGYVALGAWDVLMRKAYLQTWKAPADPNDPHSPLVDVVRGRVVLGQAADGLKVTLGAFLAQVITYAGFTADVSVGSVTVPFDEATDYSCADAITRMLHWAPDAVVWWDYTTTPATCRIRRRADLDAVALAVEGGVIGGEGVVLDARYDLLVEHVALFYIATNRSNSASWETTTIDAYPPGTTGTEDNAFVRTLRLAGSVDDSSYLTQEVDTNPIPGALTNDGLVTSGATFDSLLDWWKRKHPWLVNSLVEVKGFRKGARKRVPETDDEDQSETPTDGLRELVKGGLTEWMIEEDEQLVTEQQTVSIEVAYDLSDAVDPTKKQRLTQKLEASIVATNAQTKTYTVLESSSSTPPEDVPLGLALTLYNALSVLQWEGSIAIQERECGGLVGMGNVINLTGSREEWTAMRALVQSVSFDLDEGQTSVEVGPAAQLGVDSLVELFRHNRDRQPVTSTYSRATGSSAAQHRQALPTWQAIRAAQSGTPVAPRTYTAALEVAGVVPTAAEIKAAVESVYSSNNTPMFGDAIALTVGGGEKFRARVSSTGTASGISTVAFSVESTGYFAQVVQTVGGGSPFAFAAGTRRNNDGDVVLASIAGGRCYFPLEMSPRLTFAGFEADPEDDHTKAWLHVVWDTDYIPVQADSLIQSGTDWPAAVFAVSERWCNIPLAEVVGNALVQVVTGHIMLHRSFAFVFGQPGGEILHPVAL